MSVVQHFINEGLTPKEVLAHILPNYPILKDTTDEFAIQIILELFSEKRTREKLPNFNTFHQAVDLFRSGFLNFFKKFFFYNLNFFTI